jgi:hypothetical protein
VRRLQLAAVAALIALFTLLPAVAHAEQAELFERHHNVNRGTLRVPGFSVHGVDSASWKSIDFKDREGRIPSRMHIWFDYRLGGRPCPESAKYPTEFLKGHTILSREFWSPEATKPMQVPIHPALPEKHVARFCWYAAITAREDSVLFLDFFYVPPGAPPHVI